MALSESLTRELYPELLKSQVQGVKDGRRDSINEASHIEKYLGFKPDVEALKYVPTDIGPLQQGVLGVTQITPDGKAVRMRISNYISHLGLMMKEKYNLSFERTKEFVYRLTRDVTNHEDYHVMSAHLAKGEEITPKARDLMESITTRGRYLIAKMLGNHSKAELIEKTNPYPNAWSMSKLADWAPYEGPSGTGYKGFLGDASKEKFYKPLWRLGKSAVKAGWQKGREYISESLGPRPVYAS
jgi:hypothetical protein